MRRSRTPDPTPELTRALRGTLAGLWLERVARVFWPFWVVALLVTAALGFGLQDILAPWAMWLGLGMVAALLLSFAVSLWRFRPPSRRDACTRLDQTMAGRPLSAMADLQATGTNDPAARRIWDAHLARMAARLQTARPVAGDLRLSRFDRFGLRYSALTVAAVAVMFGAPSRVTELTDLAQLPNRAEAVALGPSWEGWIQPPAYTGRPSLYLNDVARARLDIPQGSRVTVRFYGQSGVMSVHEGLSDRADPDPHEMAQDFTIERSGRLSIRGPAGRDFEIAALIDQPPSVTLQGVAERGRGGVMQQAFSARDDYGVIGGAVRVALDLGAVDRRFGLAAAPEPREDLSLILPMPASGARDQFEDVFVEDFSQHPWANLPVTVALEVEDARGQIGQTPAAPMVLPGRRFFDPTAAAVIELRRDLLWTTENAPRVAQLMRAIAHRPDDLFRTPETQARYTQARDLLLASLDQGLGRDTRDTVAQQLWDLAVLLEEGELADARDRLQRAQDRLDEAVRNGADPSEIAELMDELREAMRDYMRQLAEQPRERGEAPTEGERMDITQDQIQQLLDRIQELMEEGRMDEAAELLAQLDALLQNLQMAEGQGGEPMPGDDAMEGLGDALREQQDLADDTFNQLQDEFRNRAGEAEGEGEGRADDLAERQRDLAEQLRDQQLQPLPGEGTDEGDAALDALERAQRAMEQAAEALEDGDTGQALSRQADAIEAMRDGLRALDQARQQDMRDQQRDGLETGEGGRRDPLGRPRSQGGEVGTDDNLLQGADVYRRAQDLLQELRRRAGEMDRSEAELDYLRRLIERF